MTGPARAPDRDQGGFALVAVILTLVALGALAAAGFMLTRTDILMSLSHRSSIGADNVAERGMARYLADHDRAGGDETYVFGSDTAVVTVTRLLEVDPTLRDTLLRITSEGIRWAGGDRARRTLSRVLVEGVERVSLNAAVTSGGGIEVTGNTSVRGDDECGGATVTGLRVASGGYFGGDADNVEGAPAVDSAYADPTAALEATDVDWAALIQDTVVDADYTIPTDAWPDFSSLPADEYPLIRISSSAGSSFELGGSESGRGTIIAEQDVVLRGSLDWRGVMLVGGAVDMSGNAQVRGTLVGNLNVLLGANPGDSQVQGTGSAEARYNSCFVADAVAQAFRWLSEVPGTRSEVMAP